MIECRAAVLLAFALAGCDRAEPTRNETSTQQRVEANATGSPATSNAVGSSPAKPPSREPIAYTSLKPADCKLLEQNVDEGGYSRHRCKGIGSYSIETSESDLREGLTVVAPGGGKTEIDLSRRVANGAFSALGPAAEWRGADRNAPSALIVRLNVAKPEPNPRDTSNLVVIRLGSPTCITAVVPPGPDQNDIARDAADDLSLDCLKTA